jgi:hypothetical protein
MPPPTPESRSTPRVGWQRRAIRLSDARAWIAARKAELDAQGQELDERTWKVAFLDAPGREELQRLQADFDMGAQRLQAELDDVEAKLTEPDPICLNCGHRALDHGFAGLSLEERRRWSAPGPIACHLRDQHKNSEEPRQCPCQEWVPARGHRTGLEDIGEAVVLETWIDVPLGAEWVIAYRLVSEQGVPVVGELRVFPAEPNRPGPGTWSGEFRGTLARVPHGGITARLLRRLRVRAYVRSLPEVLRRIREMPDVAGSLGWAPPPTPVQPRVGGPGRKGRPPVFYAAIARDYARAVKRGSSQPIKDVARQWEEESEKVREMVRRARRLNLLTAAEPGYPGGELTGDAKERLRSDSKVLRAFNRGGARARQRRIGGVRPRPRKETRRKPRR